MEKFCLILMTIAFVWLYCKWECNVLGKIQPFDEMVHGFREHADLRVIVVPSAIG